MKDGVPVLAFCGYGRAGKDTAAEWFRDHTPLKFAGGCSWTVLPHIAKDLGLSVEEAFRRRHEDRRYWYNWCNEYRRDDPARIIRESLVHSDMVCGVRDVIELIAGKAEGLIDLAVWIDRPVPLDPTVTYSVEDCDIIVRNYEGLDAFFKRLERLAKALRIPVN